MERLTRRDALASATALGAVVLAGCVAEEDDGPDGGADGGETGTPDGEPAGTTEPETTGTPDGTDDGRNDDSQADAAQDDQRQDSDYGDSADDDQREGGDDGDGDDGDGGDGEDARDDRDGGETGDGSQEDGTDDDRDGTLDGQEVVLDYTVETTETGCTAEDIGTGRGELVSRTDGTVTVAGSVVTSNPCHEAVVESVSYVDGELTLAAGAESTLGPGELCVQCLGQISYEAVISVAEGVDVDSVSVSSAGQLSGSGQ
jgi:hypothetical protein